MKRGVFILTLGLIAAGIGFCCIYLAGTSSARSLQQSEQPELAWLREEFSLSDAEFKRVSELHGGYLPQCREMCRQIDALNSRLKRLLVHATNVTPEIEGALAEASRLRSECQSMMLHHFFQVSQTMPPQQGGRYLSWVKNKVFLANYEMSEQP